MPENNSLFPEMQPNFEQYNTPEYDPSFDYYKNLTNNTYLRAALEYNKGNKSIGKESDFANLDQLDNNNWSSYSFPEYFSPKKEDFEAFRQSDYFAKLGFVKGSDNTGSYRSVQSFGDKLENAIVGGGKIAGFQFVDQLKGWGRLFDAVTEWDWSKLYDQKDLEEVNANLERIMTENRIFTDKRDEDSIFTWANAFNVVQQSGFTVGAIAEIAAEELLTAGLVSGLQGTKVASLLRTLGSWGKAAEKLQETTSSASALRKLYESGKFLPMGETVSGVAAALAKEGKSFKTVFANGFGGFYRDIRELNAAFTEARAEASGTYAELKDNLENQGVDSIKADEIARQAADTNFGINAAVIGISNRIQFDNVFRGVRGAKAMIDEASPIGMWKNTFFKRGFNLNTVKEGLRNRPIQYFKNNLTEALQENLQDASNQGVKKFYETRYFNPGKENLAASLAEGLESQYSKQGMKTFLSGFLTGAITSPLFSSVGKIYRRVGTTKEQRLQQQLDTKEKIASLNGLFSGNHGPNAALQLSIGEAMIDSLKNGDQKGFQDLKDQSVREFIRTALETGQIDAVFARLGSYVKNLSKDEFEKAFGISQSNKQSALDYVRSLEQKANAIKSDLEDFEFKFGSNPFSPTSSKTQHDAYNNAKWQFLFQKDAHRRAGERINGMIGELSTTVKSIPSTEFTILFDKNLLKSEIKSLKDSISLETESKLKKAYERRLKSLEAIAEKDEFSPAVYKQHIKNVIKSYNAQETEESIDKALEKVQDILDLKEDEKSLLRNINWLVQPANYAVFYDMHEAETAKVYNDATEPPKSEESQTVSATAVPVIEEQKESSENDDSQHLNKLDEFARRINFEGIQNRQAIMKDIFGDIENIVEHEDGNVERKRSEYLSERMLHWRKVSLAKKNLSEILEKLGDKTREDLSQVDKFMMNDAGYLKDATLNDLLKQINDVLDFNEKISQNPEESQSKPQAELKPSKPSDIIDSPKEDEYLPEEKEEQPEEQPKQEVKPSQEEVPQEYFEGSTIVNEIGNWRDNDSIGKLEAYASFKTGFLRHLQENDILGNYQFYIVPDSENLVKDYKSEGYSGEKYEGDNPFTFAGEKNGFVIILKNNKGDIAYFDKNYNETTADKGVPVILSMEKTFTEGKVKSLLESKPETRIDALKITPGAFERNKGIFLSVSDFVKDTEFQEKVKEQGSIFVAKETDANHEKGKPYLYLGKGLNDIILVPKTIDNLTYNGKNLDITQLLDLEYETNQVVDVLAYLNDIIFTNQNKGYFFSSEPAESGKQKIKVNGFDFTNKRGKFFNIERKHTDINSKEYNPSKTIFYVEKGKLVSEKVNYQDFITQNLSTTVRKLQKPDGTFTIHPINNKLIFSLNGNKVTASIFGESKSDNVSDSQENEMFEGEKKENPEDVIKRLQEKINKISKEDTENLDDINKKKGLFRLMDESDYETIDEEELQWFKDTFKDYDIVLKTVNSLINSNAWGKFTADATYIYEAAAKGTAYHEAWHNFTQLFLTPEEQDRLYSKNKIEGESFKDTEERIADKFIEFAKSGGKVLPEGIKERNIFQKIWDFIKGLFGVKSVSLDKLFNDLYKGNLVNYKMNRDNIRFPELNAAIRNRKGEEILSVEQAKEYFDYFDTLLGDYFSKKNISFNYILNLKGKDKIEEFENIFKYVLNRVIENSREIMTSGYDSGEKVETLQTVEKIIDNYSIILQTWIKRFSKAPSTKEIEDMDLLKAEEISIDSVDGENQDDTDFSKEEEEEVLNKTGEFTEKSLAQTLSKEIKHMIRVLPKVETDPATGIAKRDESGKIVTFLNKGGRTEPVNLTNFVNNLGEMLADAYTYDVMYERMRSVDNQKKLPELALLIERLPRPDETDEFARQRRSSFERDFGRSYIGVWDVSLKVKNSEEEGNETSSLQLYVNEETKRGVDFIRRKFEEEFRKLPKSAYIGKLDDGRNFLTKDFAGILDYYNAIPNSINTRISDLGKLMKYLGFNFTKNAVNSPEFRNLVTDNEKALQISKFFKEISLRINEGAIITSPIKDLFKNTDRENLSRTIFDLLRIEEKYNSDVSALTYQTAKGTQKYALMTPSYSFYIMNSIKNTINRNELPLHYLRAGNNPNLNNSLVMNSLYDQNGKRRKDPRRRNVELIFGDYNGFKYNFDGSEERKQTTDLSDREKAIMDINSFMTPGAGLVDIMRTESSASSYFYKLSSYYHNYKGLSPRVSFDIPFSLELMYTDEMEGREYIHNYFKGLFVDERDVMALQNLDKFGIFADITGQNKSMKVSEFNAKVDEFLLNETEDAKNYLYNLGIREDNYKQFINSKLLTEIDNYNLDFDKLVRAFVLNTFVLNAEYSKLIGGPIQYYKAFHKRAKMSISTGIMQSTSDYIKKRLEANQKRTMYYALKGEKSYDLEKQKVLTVSDDEVTLTHSIEKKIKKALGYVPDKYQKINAADGQGRITLDGYREFRIRTGTWTTNEEATYVREVIAWKKRKGFEITEEDNRLLEFYKDYKDVPFKPIKGQYDGPMYSEKGHYPVGHKFSLAPLIPSVIQGTELDKLNDHLLENDISYMVHESGSKKYKGTVTSMSKPSENGVMEIYSHLLKEQIVTKSKRRLFTTWGTQMRKLFMANIFDKGSTSEKFQKMFDEYSKILDNIVEIEKNALYREFGIEEEGNKIAIKDVKPFVDTILSQIEARNLNENIKKSIAYNDITGQFKYPLEINLNRQDIINLIGGMIDRRLRKVKLNGDIITLISSTGLEKEYNLRFYEPTFDKDGNHIGTKPMECVIAWSDDYKNLLNLQFKGKVIGNVDTLNEALKDSEWVDENIESLTHIGYRIPTQGPNSIEFFIPKQFTSESFFGVIPPKPYVVKTGGDFDDDKMHVFRPSLDETGRLSSEEYKNLLERKKDLLMKELKKYEIVSGLINNYLYNENDDEADDDIEMYDPKVFEILKEVKKIESEIKGYYLNAALSVYRKALSSPEMFSQLVTPNSADRVKEIAIEIGERLNLPGIELIKEGKDFAGTQVFRWKNNMLKFIQNLSGKNDLGMWAVNNTFSQILQQAGVGLNKTYKVVKAKYIFTRTTRQLLLNPEEKQNSGLTLSGKYSADESIKQEMISELINSTVDIASDPFYSFLGINNENKGVVAYLLQQGVPFRRIILFINQNILRDYYHLRKTVPKTETPSGTYVPSTNSHIKDLLGMKYTKRIAYEQALEKMEGQIEHLSEEMLLAGLNKNAKYDIQRVVLAHFAKLKEQAFLMRKVQMSNSYDTTKYSTPLSAFQNEEMYKEVVDSGLFTNLDNIKKKSYVSSFDSRSIVKGVFGAIFPYGYSEQMVQVFNNLFPDNVFSKKDKEKFERRVAADFVEFLIKNFAKSPEKDTNFSQYAIKLITDVNPLYKKMADIKSKYPELEEKFELFRKLLPNFEQNKPFRKNIELVRGLDNTTDYQDLLISEYNKLMKFNPSMIDKEKMPASDVKEIRDFMYDLARVGFFQSGFNKSLLFFSDIIPSDIFNNTFMEALEYYKDLSSEDKTKIINQFMDDFRSQNGELYKQSSRQSYRGKAYGLNKTSILSKPVDNEGDIKPEQVPVSKTVSEELPAPKKVVEEKPKQEKPKTEAEKIYSELGNKTENFGIEIESWAKLKEERKAITSDYVVSTRIKGTQEHFGNPFSSDEKVLKANPELIKTSSTKESVIKYIEWVTSSKDTRAKWIREQITSGKLDGLPILYYKELNQPSHATALAWLVDNYQFKPETLNVGTIINVNNSKLRILDIYTDITNQEFFDDNDREITLEYGIVQTGSGRIVKVFIEYYQNGEIKYIFEGTKEYEEYLELSSIIEEDNGTNDKCE